jgi:hypothetical protein
MKLAAARVEVWLADPQPILRLEIIRFLAPLAVLGFMSSRLAHADEWLGQAGFRVPDLGHADWRQPIYVPALPNAAAWLVAAAMVASGLAVSFGYRARRAALLFAACLAFVAISDRLAAFTVSKMSPVLMLVLALSPCGSRFGIDAWRAQKRAPDAPKPELVRGGVRFFQVFLPVMYCASGIAKLRGDWRTMPYVLWTHVHDTYQTSFSWAVATLLPTWSWTVFQALVLAFEVLAPLWFAWSRTRTAACIVGLAMHAMIGLMFGPVRWFALLMMSLLLGGYLPNRAIEKLHELATRFEPRRHAS